MDRQITADHAPDNHFRPSVPGASSTAAHTKAEPKLAIWNGHHGITKIPATSGTEARNGPKKRPSATANTPKRRMKASPFGSRSG